MNASNGSNLTLRNWLQEKPFTLTLSSSFFGMFAHTGLLKALHEEELYPEKLTGSSAGGLVAVLYASGLTPQQIIDRCLEIKREDILLLSSNSLPGIFNIHRAAKALISEFIPVQSFEELRLAAAVSAFDLFGMKTRVFSSGDITEALAATMSVPVLFKPTVIGGRPYWDGALLDVAGLGGVDKSKRVFYHHCTVLPPSFSGIDAYQDSATLKISGLPFLDPTNFMKEGIRAFEMAYIATKEALNEPVCCINANGTQKFHNTPYFIEIDAPQTGILPVSRL